MPKKVTTLNCFLISLIINLAFLIFLSVYNENIELKSENKFIVELISSQKATIFKNQSDDLIKNNYFMSPDFGYKTEGRYLSSETYRSIVREVAPMIQDQEIINTLNDNTPDNLLYIKQLRERGRKNVNSSNKKISGSSEISAEKTRNIGESLPNVKDLINSLDGNYNIPVIYIDKDSYNISKKILSQLANAMNRWTKIKTNVKNSRLHLDNPKILDIPMIYIAMQRPFTFSESVRQNLRKYFSQGGFLMFSNIADSKEASLEVANSFGFELWNILGDYAHNLTEVERSHPIFNCLFNVQNSPLPDILAISKEGRIFVIYEDTGYGKVWLEGINSNTETFMKMGINIIIYMLITSR